MKKLNLRAAFDSFSETWSPRIAGEVNDHEVKLAKLEGAFVWHRHDEADELFLVISGRMRMELRGEALTLEPGELVIVPSGVEHRPVALPSCEVLLFERAGTLNTGDAEDSRRVEEPERL